METFFAVILLAVVVEGLVTYFKTFFIEGVFQWQILVSIGLGVLVTIAYQVDLLALLGMTSTIPFVGYILTGIIISRGSNYVFDLIGILTTLKTQRANTVNTPRV